MVHRLLRSRWRARDHGRAWGGLDLGYRLGPGCAPGSQDRQDPQQWRRSLRRRPIPGDGRLFLLSRYGGHNDPDLGLASGKEVATLPGTRRHQQTRLLAQRPAAGLTLRGKYVAASIDILRDQMIRVLDVSTGRELRRLDGHRGGQRDHLGPATTVEPMTSPEVLRRLPRSPRSNGSTRPKPAALSSNWQR